ncbi:2OG-Fe(II) oxygenase [Streptomyces sp. NPDC091371]|uniref:2OG-Fe(II) oxygenase n=1 Tax=Streptomyces sp. NPDC091371 TaxID=3155303 RepID=UPI003448A012
MTDGAVVATLTSPGERLLAPLLDGTALAVRVPGFVPTAAAEQMAERLAAHPSLSAYRNTPELVRVGLSHYETHDADGTTNDKALLDYLSKAEQLMDEIRLCCTPYEPPLDRLWRMLDASYGLERARIAGMPMFAGVCRVFPEGSELLPHNDSLMRDAPGLPLGGELDAQLAANIYLRVPERGGELQLWDLRPDEEQLAGWRAPGSAYGADRALLPPPGCEIPVAVGDLVIVDATRLHAVSRQERGTRIGLSCFLGVRHGRPLVYWS